MTASAPWCSPAPAGSSRPARTCASTRTRSARPAGRPGPRWPTRPPSGPSGRRGPPPGPTCSPRRPGIRPHWARPPTTAARWTRSWTSGGRSSPAVSDEAALARERTRPRYDVTTVLETCVAVFNERGFDGTSMEDLSRRLGISKSSIYHHIESKEAILGLALEPALTGLEEAAAAVRALDGPAVARLETLLRTSVQVLVDRLPYVTLLLRVRGNSDV